MRNRFTQITYRGVVARNPRRRGSILILVIALLVMLALIGTAFITTARQDRSSAAVGSNNSQLDLSGNAVSSLAVNAIVDGLFDTNPPIVGTSTDLTYREPNPIPTMAGVTASKHEDVDSPVNDLFLASRSPLPVGAGGVQWEWISAPLGGAAFDDPTNITTTPYWFNDSTGPDISRVTPNPRTIPSARNNLAIGTAVFGGKAYPTLGGRVAADADGDGIADAGLFQVGSLPGSKFAGVTLYAGVRIIDNNSAINASTAWQYSNDLDLSGAAARNNRFNPASIGLQEILTTYGFSDVVNFGALGGGYNNYRFNGTNLLSPGTNPSPLGDYDPAAPAVATPKPRADFAYLSQMDWFWNALGSRPNFPGFNPGSAIGTGLNRFQAPPLSDTAVLASRAGIRSSSTTATLEGVGMLPSALANGTVPTAPYSPANGATDITNWYNEFYNPSSLKTLRALMVTRNPVSDAAPAHNMPGGTDLVPYSAATDGTPAWSSTQTYRNGDVVSFTTTLATAVSAPRAYRSIVDNNVNQKPDTATAAWVELPSYVGVYQTPAAGQSYQIGDVITYYNYPPPGTLTESNTYVAVAATALDPVSAPASWQLYAYTPFAGRVDANTAGFADLRRAFWNTMVGNVIASGGAAVALTPFDTGTPAITAADTYKGNQFSVGAPSTDNTAVHPERMFRSSLRDTSSPGIAFIVPDQMMLLRSALAAVNTEAIRDASTENVKAERINLNVNVGGTSTPVKADVYGVRTQPFLTEVYVQTDITPNAAASGTNLNGYIALEFYNPYPVAIALTNWHLATIGRGTGDGYPGAGATRTLADQADFTTLTDESGAAPVIPANGYLVVENFDKAAAGVGAAYRPGSSNLPPNGPIGHTGVAGMPDVVVVDDPALIPANLYGKEIILLRPHAGSVAGGTLTCTRTTGTNYDDTAANLQFLQDMIPCDSFDFSGFVAGTDPGAGMPATANTYYYSRETDSWKFVYPGRYDGTAAFHQQGVYDSGNWDPRSATDPGTGTYTPTFGKNVGGGNVSNVNAKATYPDTFPIQINDTGFGGTNPVSTGVNKYPFGGFALEGHLLQIPFIGAYKIADTASPSNLYEMNSVSADSAFAEDTDTTDNFEENVGHFCPIAPVNTIANVNDFPNAQGLYTPNFVRYGWAARIFDYLCIGSPYYQHLPNVEPGHYAVADGTAPPPQPVAKTAAGFSSSPTIQSKEQFIGREGLININTAPLPVLAAVPWSNDAGIPRTTANFAIAQAIVNYRYNSGGTPRYFHNLFELNLVPGFRTDAVAGAGTPAWGSESATPATTATFTTTSFKTADNGDFSGSTPVTLPGTYGSSAGDSVQNDFESQFLALTGVSNLITTRSDTFTVYVVLEGWENAHTSLANRVFQRRYAFLVDRTGVTSANTRGNVRITPIPTN